MTAYESLTDEDRAILILLGAACMYSLVRQVWVIQFKWKGQAIYCAYSIRGNTSLKEYLGYFMDWGVFPAQKFNFEGVIHGSENW